MDLKELKCHDEIEIYTVGRGKQTKGKYIINSAIFISQTENYLTVRYKNYIGTLMIKDLKEKLLKIKLNGQTLEVPKDNEISMKWGNRYKFDKT